MRDGLCCYERSPGPAVARCRSRWLKGPAGARYRGARPETLRLFQFFILKDLEGPGAQGKQCLPSPHGQIARLPTYIAYLTPSAWLESIEPTPLLFLFDPLPTGRTVD